MPRHRQEGRPSTPDRVLGVLGGMGPLATADFLTKLVRATEVTTDQEHVPVVMVGDPRIPDRTEALKSGRFEEVSAALLERIAKLKAAGADAVAIPCNSAHAWYGSLKQQSDLPIIHIADASIEVLRQRKLRSGLVTVWATPATRAGGFYPPKLSAAGFTYLETPDELIEKSIMPAIRSVKAGKSDRAREELQPAIDFAEEAGAEQAILACTELPLAAEGVTREKLGFVDTSDALADACITWWRTGRVLGSPAQERGE